MGINNIQLSNQLLAALYPDCLVPGRDPDARPPVRYRFLGNNLRKICFLVYCPDVVFLPEDQLGFLTRILSACHYTLADTAVLNLAETTADIAELKRQLNPEIVFLCGIDPAPLHLLVQAELFNITRFQGISLLLLPSLSEINQETTDGRQLKTKLWNCLQKLFRL